MSSAMTRRVLLVDDHDLIRQGLSRSFERSADLSVAGQAGSVADAHTLADTLRPDVVVTDVRLPDGSGIDLVRGLRKDRPSLGIVVLTMYAGDDQLFAAMEAGASAFVSKDAPAADVVAAARRSVTGPTAFAAADLTEALRRRMTSTRPRLTARELDVLALLADGLGLTAISRRMFVSESTTKSHVTRIYEKLGAANRAQAILNAVRAGYLRESLTGIAG